MPTYVYDFPPSGVAKFYIEGDYVYPMSGAGQAAYWISGNYWYVSIGVGSGPRIGIQKGPPRFAFRTTSARAVGAGRDCGDGASAG
jgi:hypothetical protein